MTETAPPDNSTTAFVPAVKVGDRVWYIPDPIHTFDKDHRAAFVFAFHHTRDWSSRKLSYKSGERVTRWDAIGTKNWRRNKDGLIKTGSGHIIEPGEPLAPWPAIVREVFADGTVALDVAHPISGSLVSGHAIFAGDVGLTLHYPRVGLTTGLHYDASGHTPHTWHLLTDTAKGA